MEAAVAAQSMFRAMKADSDGYPTTGSSSRTLGVRIDGLSRDILVALDRTVSPGTGGMSVALSVAGPRRVVQPDEPSKLRVAELGHREPFGRNHHYDDQSGASESARAQAVLLRSAGASGEKNHVSQRGQGAKQRKEKQTAATSLMCALDGSDGPAGCFLCRSKGRQFPNPALHSPIVRSPPVDAAAIRALPEFIVQFCNTGRDKAADSIFRDIRERCVASHAACEGSNGARQIEAVHNFGDLTPAVAQTKPVAMRHLAAHEESAIAREENSALGRRDFRQFFVGRATPVPCIKAKHSEVGGQLAEMNVEDEPGVSERLGAYADFRRDVERFKDWINAQAVARMDEPVEPGRNAVDEDEIDFGMRYAETFNEIFS